MIMKYLFRGKDENGNWRYGDLVHEDTDGSSKIIKVGIRSPKCYPVEVIPETVGQLICEIGDLKIFGGDIIRVWNTFEYSCYEDACHEADVFDLVVSDDGEIETEVLNLEISNTMLRWFVYDELEIRLIIGNIHDNPELTK